MAKSQNLPPYVRDIAGQRFGQLVAVEFVELRRRRGSSGNDAFWRCVCDCGASIEAHTAKLRSEGIRSCGCLKVTSCRVINRTHGRSKTKAHRIWCHMLARCRNPSNAAFQYYGGRGISVCEEWQEFETFFADMGECPPGFSIERRDVNGNYNKENCIWLPLADQARNTRRNRYAVFNGERMMFSDAAKKLGVSASTISHWARGRSKPPASLNIVFDGAS